MDEAAPPVLAPVRGPTAAAAPDRLRSPALWLALVLALGVAAAAVASVLLDRGGGGAAAGPFRVPPRFGAGTEARLAVLRDRLARGLLSLRRAAGDFSTRADEGFVDPVERTEATAIGIAGLAAAVRLRAEVPGIDRALAEAKELLGKRQVRSGAFDPPSAKPRRGLAASTLSCAVLALSIAGDPADLPRLERAAQSLVSLSGWGPLAGGWVQGVAVRAMAELRDDGRAALLGQDPIAAIPTRRIGDARDASDARVSEALAQAVRAEMGAPSPLPDEILAKVLADPPVWVGPQTDLYSWAIQGWLAARRPAGDAWFARVLPELEKAVPPEGVVPGEMYGDPVSRTSCALLILLEGWGLRR